MLLNDGLFFSQSHLGGVKKPKVPLLAEQREGLAEDMCGIKEVRRLGLAADDKMVFRLSSGIGYDLLIQP